MHEKINKINLNLNNFVFLSPEAASCEPLGDDFWINNIKSIKGKCLCYEIQNILPFIYIISII